MKEQMLSTRRGAFGVRISGVTTAPLVVCLHGFPDDATTFDDLAEKLVAHGYRVAAPYLRGYAPSPLQGPFKTGDLVDDLIAIIEVLSPDHAVFLVGHDYGAQYGYAALASHQDRFVAAAMLAGVHSHAINSNIKRLPKQWWMSRYIIFFQFKSWADRAVERNNFAYIDRLMRRWSPNYTPLVDHIAHVKQTLRASMPHPVAMYREGDFDIGSDKIAVPTLFIAGKSDGCSSPELALGQEHLFTNGYAAQTWENVGHFPHLERPQETASAIIDWFGRHA